MKFKTTDYMSNKFNGTSLQGYVTCDYAKLVEVFGKPTYGPDDRGDKVTCEWCIEFEDGSVATIYDWKEYETPFGTYSWHIGGKNTRAAWNVQDLLEGK